MLELELVPGVFWEVLMRRFPDPLAMLGPVARRLGGELVAGLRLPPVEMVRLLDAFRENEKGILCVSCVFFRSFRLFGSSSSSFLRLVPALLFLSPLFPSLSILLSLPSLSLFLSSPSLCPSLPLHARPK